MVRIKVILNYARIALNKIISVPAEICFETKYVFLYYNKRYQSESSVHLLCGVLINYICISFIGN